MVDHLKDLQEIAHDFHEVGGVSAETVHYIDARVRLQELRQRLPAVQDMPGQAIRQLRERFDLSQAMLAEYVNMSVVTISKWERGEKKPNGAALRVLNTLARKGPDAFA
ncbi:MULTISPECIES: helix-turn-helix domain-containing protein [Erwinia]|jgi:putative transcriptional regulator|uniref:Helix-turn-helix domain-containing protein n=2 Tax=Erwinia TaxID=551 RepID=A0ABV4E4K9_9GAMM|nr:MULTISPECIES: helix-turn-helix domain-containing protein [unclassified Erwinia]MDN4626535.1 helix-turn-helix domain-containing protein [Erwinia sp. PsM31]MDN8540990.1 helix-turn-helix domain-containing protein [Erwinia sp. BC051422]